MSEEKPWKKGIFEIAQETSSTIQPFRIKYTPLREAAYIDDDFLPAHLYQLIKLGGLEASIEFHEPITEIKDPIQECEKWRQWSKI